MLSIYVRTTGFLRRSAALFCHDADRAARSRSPHHPRRSFSPEHLNPSPDATGINQKTTLRSHFRRMLERDWIPQVPSRAPQDNVTGIVAPFERIGGSDGQHSPSQRASTRFRRGTSLSSGRPTTTSGIPASLGYVRIKTREKLGASSSARTGTSGTP
jgi:hypothetical protein